MIKVYRNRGARLQWRIAGLMRNIDHKARKRSVVACLFADQDQGIGLEGGLHALAIRTHALHLVAAVIGFDATDLPTLVPEFFLQRLARLPCIEGRLAAGARRSWHCKSQQASRQDD